MGPPRRLGTGALLQYVTYSAYGCGVLALRVAVLGLGTVGEQVVRLLDRERALFAERVGEEVEVGHILVHDAARARPDSLRGRITLDPEVIFKDPAVEIVVEVMGGLQPAHSYMERALASGRSVVTANKEVIAARGPALSRTAAPGATLLFEAAVAAGIPILRAIQESLLANRISSIHGIVNGSTNFLLTRMHETGDPFAVALHEAKELGYLEADPADDLDGVDAARKIAILAGLSFGGWFPVDEVRRTGIRAVSADDVRAVRSVGGAIKLLAEATGTDAGVYASVEPTVLGPGHPLKRVDGPQNAVYVQGDPVGEILLSGLGAGGPSTGSAVVGDVLLAARMRRLGGRPPELPLEPVPVVAEGERRGALAIRCTAERGRTASEVRQAVEAHGIGVRESTATLESKRQEFLVITAQGRREAQRQALERLGAAAPWLRIEAVLAAQW